MLTETDFYKAVLMGDKRRLFMIGRQVIECNICETKPNLYCDEHYRIFVEDFYVVGNYKIIKECHKTDNSLCRHFVSQIMPETHGNFMDGHKIYRLLEKSGFSHEHFDQYKTYEGWNELTEEGKEERVAQEKEEEERKKQKKREEEKAYAKEREEYYALQRTLNTAEKRLAKLKEKNNIIK